MEGIIKYEHMTTIIRPEECKKAVMSDQEINYRSNKEAIDEYKSSPLRWAAPVIGLGFIAGDSVVEGALAKEANKTTKMLKKAGFYGLVLGVAVGLAKVADKVIKNVPAFNEYRKEHPTATSLGVIIGAISGGVLAAEPLGGLIKKAFNNDVGKKIIAPAERVLSKENFKNFMDSKIFKPVEKLLDGGRRLPAFELGAIAVLGGLIAKQVYDVNHARQTAKQLKSDLEKQRLEGQLNLAENTLVERGQIKITSQDNPFQR